MKKYMFFTAALVMAIFLSKYADETSKDLEHGGGTMAIEGTKSSGLQPRKDHAGEQERSRYDA